MIFPTISFIFFQLSASLNHYFCTAVAFYAYPMGNAFVAYKLFLCVVFLLKNIYKSLSKFIGLLKFLTAFAWTENCSKVPRIMCR